MERRQDDVRIEVLSERIEHILQNQEKYSVEAREWRGKVDSSLAEMKQTIATLPCEGRKEQTKGIKFQLNLFWWIIGIMAPSLLGLAVAWGSINKQVEINTRRWENVLYESNRT